MSAPITPRASHRAESVCLTAASARVRRSWRRQLGTGLLRLFRSRGTPWLPPSPPPSPSSDPQCSGFRVASTEFNYIASVANSSVFGTISPELVGDEPTQLAWLSQCCDPQRRRLVRSTVPRRRSVPPSMRHRALCIRPPLPLHPPCPLVSAGSRSRRTSGKKYCRRTALPPSSTVHGSVWKRFASMKLVGDRRGEAGVPVPRCCYLLASPRARATQDAGRSPGRSASALSL